MKIITTPMCEDILIIAGINNYEVVGADSIKDADIAIVLSETESNIPSIKIKLNTYEQVYESIIKIQKKFSSNINLDELEKIEKLIVENNRKKDNRKNTKIKVYSNFLKDTIINMGYTVSDSEYDFVVKPDYLNIQTDKKNIINVPSHKNVSKKIIQRLNERYSLLENEICMKH